MSVVVQTAHAAASVAPSLTPTVSPTVTPVVHVANHAAQAVASSNGLVSLLTSFIGSLSQADIIAAGAAVAVVLQGFINKHPWLQSELAWLQNVKRFLVAVALPYLGALLASFATGQNTLHLALPVFVAGQFLFYLYQSLKGAILSSQTFAATEPAAAEQVGQG